MSQSRESGTASAERQQRPESGSLALKDLLIASSLANQGAGPMLRGFAKVQNAEEIARLHPSATRLSNRPQVTGMTLFKEVVMSRATVLLAALAIAAPVAVLGQHAHVAQATQVPRPSQRRKNRCRR